MLVMLADKHTRNTCLLCDPSDQDTLARTPLWSAMMKELPSGNGLQDPKQAEGNDSGQLAQSPQVLICQPPLLGHHPMVTSLLDRSKVIIRPMKDGNGGRTFELVLINQTNQIPCNETLPLLVCLASKLRSNRPWAQVAPNDEPPIPGPSPSSKPHENVPTREPEPEVAVTQSMEEPFGKFQLHFFCSSQLFLTFSSTISSFSHCSPLCNYHQKYARWIPPPICPSPTLPPSACVPPPSVRLSL
ncbi:hypothetical protein O181_042025 [Austropuccinia psidii MF-1]|uniref:Uncharacterized protein n=1 Tax=Austropuccinia psidii MF-1 TaxID=1389203 RepID=A0A9Q3DJU5_9BASI|nr:hypothetical protein [Austropuccinia psidii MF-1]